MNFFTTTSVTTDDICKELSKRHDYFDENNIRSAYAIMMRHLKKEDRENEINRYLKIACCVAQLNFGVDVVAAVFLVEAKEDYKVIRDGFGITAMRIVRAYQFILQSQSSSEEWIKIYNQNASLIFIKNYGKMQSGMNKIHVSDFIKSLKKNNVYLLNIESEEETKNIKFVY